MYKLSALSFNPCKTRTLLFYGPVDLFDRLPFLLVDGQPVTGCRSNSHVFSLAVSIKAVAGSTSPFFFLTISSYSSPSLGRRPPFCRRSLPYYHQSASPRCRPAGRPSLDTHAAYCFHMIRGRVAGLGCWSCLFPMVPASSQRVRPGRGGGGGGSGGRLAERGSVPVSGPLAVLQSLSCRPSVHVAPTSIHGFQRHPASPATHLRCSLAISV